MSDRIIARMTLTPHDRVYLAHSETVSVDITEHPELVRLRGLVERFVRNASNGREKAPRWVGVKTATGHGSTIASALCVEFGVDPAEDAGVRRPYPGEECPFCGEDQTDD